MGASSWRYYTPYQPDPEAALQQLRRDVFARGEYSFGFGGFAGPGGPFAGGPFAGGPGVPPDLAAGLPPQLQLLNAAAQMAGTDERVARAVMTGDLNGLNDEQRRAAEQLRPFFQMAQSHLTEGRSVDEIGDDEGEEGHEDDEGPRQFTPGQRPETIEELLEMVAEDGTHSVLDIEQTGSSRTFGVAAPMPARRIGHFFGTEQPTHDAVEQNWGDAAEELERWQAYYVTVYRDGKPHEYAFIGCSGD
jgi:hypothetical protein